jgi:hypothetical protein
VIQDILADLEAGMTYREAAMKHSVTYWQVIAIAGRAGIRRKGRDHRLPARKP